jgi:2-polyprenyl-3-methyl-5-hydroxy-6-metoxy-1,4-benzoquinol methylase
MSQPWPNVTRLAAAQLAVWPDHGPFIEKRLAAVAEDQRTFLDSLAGQVLQLAGDELAHYAQDYRWTCELLLEEEFHFRRTGRYRLTRFSDAAAEIYDRPEIVERYMNGLLLSQIWWPNHTDVLQYFADVFLTSNREGYDHLEIGPGHGLFLLHAARDPRCARANGWDVSAASVEATRRTLAALNAEAGITLETRDLFAPGTGTEMFDSIVLSEVLEHLETPERALAVVRDLLRPGGRVFVNVPVNSPAPDHIFLWNEPEEIVSLVSTAGFDVEAARFYPAAGVTEAQARRRKMTISCAVIGRRGEDRS